MAALHLVLLGHGTSDKPRSLVERSVEVMVDGVDGGAVIKECFDALGVSPQRREVQRGRPVVVLGVDVGADGDEASQDVHVAGVGGVVKWRVPDGVLDVDVGLEEGGSSRC